MAITAKARGLGAELRELRKEAGLTVRALEERLSFSRSTISRIERGDKVPSAEDLGAMLAIYNVTGKRRRELIQLAKDADRPNWTEIGDNGIPRQLAALLEFEREATRISMVALNRVPGLLQTRAYARAVLESGGVSSAQIETLVNVRMRRQEILRRADPVDLLVILDEAVLRRPVGGPPAMAEQLKQILAAVKADNILVQVLPFALGGHIGQDGSHVIYEFEKADPIVHLEHRRSSQFLDEVADTKDFCEITDTLRTKALSPSGSADLIAAYVDDLEEQ
ncbi:helix-turn-helix transcriptional regulator [Saccharopolyspora sp. WRP15-2]|uniref:Helix-turn-helix transcriptional regulator n=1 Tax=Saccharopolyspora oryzae TaxID=2997343 RepID=A0ABT4V2Y6_9PSEU|nr:helix-turn-helix transcriptional regulator [Saccharopolyspora oryzae]MDA3627759.1 helix-turn-helix transcriptional regulator [Saccharopolyspora oryzae]